MGSSESEAPLLPPQRGEEEAGCRCRWWRGGASWAEATAEAGRLAALAAPMIAVALLQLMMQLILSITDTRYADTGTGTAIRRYGDFQKIRIRRYGKYIYF